MLYHDLLIGYKYFRQNWYLIIQSFSINFISLLQFSNLRNINYLKSLSFSSCNSFVVGLNFFIIMKNACHLSLFHLLPVQHLHIWFGYIFIPYGQPVIITKLQSHKFRGNIRFRVKAILPILYLCYHVISRS